MKLPAGITMARIPFRENGPVVINLPAGTTFVLDGQTKTLERNKLALCRCGAVKTKAVL